MVRARSSNSGTVSFETCFFYLIDFSFLTENKIMDMSGKYVFLFKERVWKAAALSCYDIYSEVYDDLKLILGSRK